MPQVLMIVGAILVLAGIAGIAAGAPDWLLGLSLGAALILSGAIAFVGGLVLVALALVLQALQQMLDRLDATTPMATRSVRPASASSTSSDASQHRSSEATGTGATESLRVPSLDLSIEETVRARRDRLSEGGSLPRDAGDDDDKMPVRGERASEFRSGSARSREPLSSSRREEPPRPRRESLPPPSPPPPLPVPLDDRRRPRASGGVSNDFPPPRFRPLEPPASPEAKVVRSGVIGGMAYTLYSDGSIEAELPIGTVRFGSIAELQDHVMRTGAEADVDFSERRS
jgi:hypothetical protein